MQIKKHKGGYYYANGKERMVQKEADRQKKQRWLVLKKVLLN